MRAMSANEFIGSPSQYLKDHRVTLLQPANRLFMYALEAITSNPKFSEFFIHVERNGENIGKVKVFDAFQEVASITTYQPTGETRVKDQLQLAYDYEVQRKNPKSVRRSSDVRKIQEMVGHIRPLSVNKTTDFFAGLFEHAVLKLSGGSMSYDGVDDFFRSLYYGNAKAGLEIIRDIFAGGSGGSLAHHEGLERLAKRLDKEADTKSMTIRELANSLVDYVDRATKETSTISKEMVGIVELPEGKYWEVRRKMDGSKVDWETKKYSSRDELPQDVAGRLAVMDIKLMGDENEHRRYEHQVVEGIGMAISRSDTSGLENAYVFSVS